MVLKESSHSLENSNSFTQSLQEHEAHKKVAEPNLHCKADVTLFNICDYPGLIKPFIERFLPALEQTATELKLLFIIGLEIDLARHTEYLHLSFERTHSTSAGWKKGNAEGQPIIHVKSSSAIRILENVVYGDNLAKKIPGFMSRAFRKFDNWKLEDGMYNNDTTESQDQRSETREVEPVSKFSCNTNKDEEDSEVNLCPTEQKETNPSLTETKPAKLMMFIEDIEEEGQLVQISDETCKYESKTQVSLHHDVIPVPDFTDCDKHHNGDEISTLKDLLKQPLLVEKQNEFEQEKESSNDDSSDVNYGDLLRDLEVAQNFKIRPPDVILVYMQLERPPLKIGDMPWSSLREEQCRLVTFAKYPHCVAKSAILLATNGFAYIGSGKGHDDKVICYFCCQTKEGWCMEDDILEVHKAMSPECPMVTGTECDNVPSYAISSSSDPFRDLLNSYKETSTPAITNNIKQGNQTDIEADSAPIASQEQQRTSSLSGTAVAAANLPASIQGSKIGQTLLSSSGNGQVATGQVAMTANKALNNGDTTTAMSTATTSPSMQEGRQPQAQLSGSSNARSQTTINAASPIPTEATAKPVMSQTPHQTSRSGNGNPSNHTAALNTTPAVSSNTAPVTPANGSASPSSTNPPATTIPNTNQSSTVSSGSSQSSQSAPRGRGPTYSELGIMTERPKRYEYAVLAARLETFGPWPRDHHLKKEELAEAGFYYAGYGDCARCFFCGGGLRNWEDEDDVWVEHARWFPRCAFIRQAMGQAFVDTVQDLNKDHDSIPFEMVTKAMRVPVTYFQISSKDLCFHLKRDPAVKSVVDMGFKEDDVIQLALGIKERGDNLSADSLYNALHKNGKSSSPTKAAADVSSRPTSLKSTITKQEIEDLKEKNNELRQQTVCKICMDKEVTVVFLPCGHLISCSDCASAMKDCPVCRKTVKGIVRAFFG